MGNLGELEYIRKYPELYNKEYIEMVERKCKETLREISTRFGELDIDSKKMWIDYEQWEQEQEWIKSMGG